MRGSGSTTRASAYGFTPRTSRTSSRPPPSRPSPSNVIDVDEDNDAVDVDGDWCQNRSEISRVSASPTKLISGPVFSGELQAVGVRWKFERQRGPLIERRQRRFVLRRDICQSSPEWSNRHVRSHTRLGDARTSPVQLAYPGFDLGLSPRKLRPSFSPKHLDFVTKKNSFFCHLENTVFQTLEKNAFFIRFANLLLFLGGSNNHSNTTQTKGESQAANLCARSKTIAKCPQVGN